MGLFQNILKGIARDAVNDAINKGLQGAVNTEPQSAPAAASVSENTALNPPKPFREIRNSLYDEDENGKEVKFEYSFMLSKDFVDSSTGAMEIDYVAVYAPDCNEDYVPCDSGQANFIVSSAPENEIYYMIDKYKHSGTPYNVYSFERVTDMGPRVYFKACAHIGFLVYYFYAIDRGFTYNNNYIGITYDEKLRGTALEKRMTEELDEAVRSYKENIL